MIHEQRLAFFYLPSVVKSELSQKEVYYGPRAGGIQSHSVEVLDGLSSVFPYDILFSDREHLAFVHEQMHPWEEAFQNKYLKTQRVSSSSLGAPMTLSSIVTIQTSMEATKRYNRG